MQFRNLPAGLCYKHYWREYLARDLATNKTACTYQTFNDRLQSVFPHIRLHPDTEQLKCDLCTHYNTIIVNAADEQIETDANAALRVHIKQQMDERLHYVQNQERAKRYPNKYLSIIADCRAKQPFPMFHTNTHARQKSKDKLHLVTLGLINHSANSAEFLISLDQWPSNQNFIISGLMQHITRYMDSTGRHPSTLYLQLDNCCPTNKNRIMLAWAACLVKHGWFKEVHLSYLMVGHTHEDIDQLFSQLWALVVEGPVYTIDDYTRGIQELFRRSRWSYNKIDVYHQDTCWDWEAWLNAFTYDAHHLETCHGFLVVQQIDENGVETIVVNARYLNAGNEAYKTPYQICTAFPVTDMPPQIPLESAFHIRSINKLFVVFAHEWSDRPDVIFFWEQIKSNARTFLQLNLADNIVLIIHYTSHF